MQMKLMMARAKAMGEREAFTKALEMVSSLAGELFPGSVVVELQRLKAGAEERVNNPVETDAPEC